MPAAPPASPAALGNHFSFFPSCVYTSVCTGFLRETPAPWPWDAHGATHGATQGLQSPSLDMENVPRLFGPVMSPRWLG